MTSSPAVDASPVSDLQVAELVGLAAGDLEFYSRRFFPEVVRQDPAKYHQEMDDLLLSDSRYVGFALHRDSGKTTRLRIYTSYRIAYGLSRTILFVSKAQDHSIKSLQWLKRQVEEQSLWAQVFGVERGQKWSDEWIELYLRSIDQTVNVVALGITGQTRGLNINTYRPDLIITDDPCDEENTATAEQRVKTHNLFFGSLIRSLVPESENPESKAVLAQTILHGEDLISTCLRDPQWVTRVYSVFDESGESNWPARYPTEKLRAEKAAYIARNQASLWLREMECRVVSPETAYFRREWLSYWELVPDKMVCFIAIDPVPPPSDSAIAKGLTGKDWEAIGVIGASRGNFYLLEYRINRGHTPEWTLANLFSLADKWKPLKIVVSGIAYERVLKYLIEKEMQRRRRFIQVDARVDKRAKTHRVAQSLSGIASAGRLHIQRSMVEFEEQFISFPGGSHDDILDMVSMGLDALNENPDLLDSTFGPEEELAPIPLEYLQRAP